MSTPDSLKELYLDELKDLWSANDQMSKALGTLSDKVGDAKLKKLFEGSPAGIGKHTEAIKALIEAAGGEAEPEHCKGMEGLVAEARKHGLREPPEDPTLLDLVLIAQYQRMSHYGVAGFGTAAAYATALGLAGDAAKLRSIVAEIYKADEITSRQAERLEKAAAKQT